MIKWRLDNDSTVREAFYSTDGDETDRFFLGVPLYKWIEDMLRPGTRDAIALLTIVFLVPAAVSVDDDGNQVIVIDGESTAITVIFSDSLSGRVYTILRTPCFDRSCRSVSNNCPDA